MAEGCLPRPMIRTLGLSLLVLVLPGCLSLLL
jgi:hypothetical protein